MKNPTYTELDQVPETMCRLYTNTLALAEVVKQAEAKLVSIAQGLYGDSEAPFNLSNAGLRMVSAFRSEVGSDLAASKAWLATLKDSPEFKEAAEILEPLLRRKAEFEAAEEARQIAHAQAQARHREALQAAEAKALAHAQKDSAVLAAKAALEKLTATS